MNIYIHENMKQVTRIRYKTEDNPPMANVPLIGYSKKYDCWVALVYRKGDNYYTNMECDVEYKTSPPDEYEYVYPGELEGIYLYLSMINIILILFMLLFLFKSYLCISIKNQIVMNKLILNDIQDLWRWREKINIDDLKEDPIAEDMPLYFPCAVVWHEEHDDYICYGFVYIAEILGI